MKKFARKCDVTGRGMNEGYVLWDGEMYAIDEASLLKLLRENGDEEYNNAKDEFILSDAYYNDAYYYTEWEDEDEWEYYEDENGNIVEL